MGQPQNPLSIPMTSLGADASELARFSSDLHHWGVLALAMLGVRGTCKIAKASPSDHRDSSWSRSATHWSCTIRTPFGSATTPYSLGSGHRGRAAAVLEVLHGLAESKAMLSTCPDAQDLISEGYCSGSHALADAKKIIAANRRSAIQFCRLAGPFADAGEALEASSAARAFCSEHPEFAHPSRGRPFGLAEIAAVCGDARLLADSLAQGEFGSDRTALLSSLAEEFGHPELSTMAKAMAERSDIASHATLARPRACASRSL